MYFSFLLVVSSQASEMKGCIYAETVNCNHCYKINANFTI